MISKNWKIEYIKRNFIFKCKNCTIGFKLCENTRHSCKRHVFDRDNTQQLFPCCGKNEPGSHCVEGYHIPTPSLRSAYDELKDILSGNLK